MQWLFVCFRNAGEYVLEYESFTPATDERGNYGTSRESFRYSSMSCDFSVISDLVSFPDTLCGGPSKLNQELHIVFADRMHCLIMPLFRGMFPSKLNVKACFLRHPCRCKICSSQKEIGREKGTTSETDNNAKGLRKSTYIETWRQLHGQFSSLKPLYAWSKFLLSLIVVYEVVFLSRFLFTVASVSLVLES